MKRMIAAFCILAMLFSLSACHPSQEPGIEALGGQESTAPQQSETQPTQTQPADTKPLETNPTEPEPTVTEPSDPEPTATEPTATEPTETEPTESEPTEPDPEVAAMQELLEPGWWNWYNDALTSDYETAADIDLYFFFYGGFEDEPQKPTDEERIYLDTKWPEHWVNYDLIRLPTKKMDTILMEYFGINLEQTNRVGLDKLVYWEETDCYYQGHTGANYADIVVRRVEHQDDGSICVYYSRRYPEGEMVVTLMPKGDGYQILSNMPA